jgi:hypothetical protein
MDLSNYEMESSCQILVEEDVVQLVRETNTVCTQLQVVKLLCVYILDENVL